MDVEGHDIWCDMTHPRHHLAGVKRNVDIGVKRLEEPGGRHLQSRAGVSSCGAEMYG